MPYGHACLPAFASSVLSFFYVPYVSSFFMCLTYLNFSTCPMCLHFLGALRDFGFHVSYVPSFFYVLFVPSFFTCLTCPYFCTCLTFLHIVTVFSAVIFLRASRAFIILCVLCLHFLTCLHFIYGSRKLPKRKIAPQPQKLTLSQTGGNFPGGRQLSGYLYLCICQ